MQKRSHDVHRRIYTQILNGTLRPGQKLSLRKLAASFDSSITPVIEALNLLTGDGLVESRPHWGYFVSLPTREQIADHLVMREAIESQVARRLNEHLGVRPGNKLRKAAAHLDAMAVDFVIGKHSEADIERAHCDFHLEMARMADCQLLVDALQKINLQFLLIKADSARLRHEVPAHWHTQLIGKILDGSLSDADQAMREHVRHSQSALFEQLPTESPTPRSFAILK